MFHGQSRRSPPRSMHVRRSEETHLMASRHSHGPSPIDGGAIREAIEVR